MSVDSLRDHAGANIPCVSRTAVSITWRIEMEKVAVFPVPDCA